MLPRWLRLLLAALIVSAMASGFATTGIIVWQVDQLLGRVEHGLERIEVIEERQRTEAGGLAEREEDRLKCLMFPLAQAQGFDVAGLASAHEHCADVIEGWPPQPP